MTTTPVASLQELQLQPLNSPVATYLDRYHDGESHWDLDAPYQRGSVWSHDQRCNLIKSLLMGLPVGSITVAVLGVHVEKYQRVIDGKQRVEAVRAFASDELAVPGWWWRPEHLKRGEYARKPGQFVAHRLLTDSGRRHFESRQMPQLQFKSGERRVPPEPGKERGGWPVVRLTDEQTLAAEAELYLLINFGGIEQTDADKQRATVIAR